MNKSPMLLVSPTIETNETKNDPRVPYDPPSRSPYVAHTHKNEVLYHICKVL